MNFVKTIQLSGVLVLLSLPCVAQNSPSTNVDAGNDARILTFRYYGYHEQSSSMINIDGGDEACMRMSRTQAGLIDSNHYKKLTKDQGTIVSWGLCSDKKGYPLFEISCKLQIEKDVKAFCQVVPLHPALLEDSKSKFDTK